MGKFTITANDTFLHYNPRTHDWCDEVMKRWIVKIIKKITDTVITIVSVLADILTIIITIYQLLIVIFGSVH